MNPTRRQWLHYAIGAGASLALHAGTDKSSRAAEASLNSVSRRSRALGASVAITALHRDESIAQRGIDDAFAAIERVEELMSIYRPESQLSRLNRDGRLAGADPQLLDVLRYAVELSRRTSGAFDVTVQPLWRLYAEADKQQRIPDDAEVAAARRLVDWKAIRLQGDTVEFTRPGMQITLNGIAQGYAADRAMEALVKAGVRHAIVDSGEIGALGDKHGGAPWKVGIQHPRHEDAYVSLAALADRCLATSGDYATRFGGDYEYNHLFDPRTGRSPGELASVSIAAPTSMQADALSTAVFVLGVQRGLELIRTAADVDALLVLKGGRMLATPGFPVCDDEGEEPSNG